MNLNRTKKILSKKGNMLAIAFVILTAILAALTTEKEMTIIKSMIEENVFEPLCKGEQSLKFSYDSFCKKQSWVSRLGTSADVDSVHGNLNHANVLFLKIDTSEVPRSNYFVTVNIKKAELILKTRYEPAINNNVTTVPFVVISQMCKNTDWSSDTNATQLPCISRDEFPEGELATFDPLNPKWIDDVRFNLKPHIDTVRNSNKDSFTELIQFYPTKLSIEHGFDDETRKCVESKSSEYLAYANLDDCLGKYRIATYSTENPSTGARPQLNILYTIAPTSLTQSIIAAAVAGIPIVAAILQFWYNQSESQKSKMQSICNTLEQEINDIQNGLTDPKYEHVNKVRITNEQNEVLLEFDLPKTVSLVYLSTDAYQGIINSGSFENFKSEDQTTISTLYNLVKIYNENLSYVQRQEDEFMKNHHKIDDDDIWAYKRLISYYYQYLGDQRDNIIHNLESVKQIISQEKTRFT